jgi:hypothetical protein
MPEPVFHAIVVVDIEGFGRRTHPMQRKLRKDMYGAVRTALDEAGLDHERIVQEDRGDGILLLDPDTSTERLAGRFVRALDDALREHARMSSPEAVMRLRVALHHGPCEFDGDGWVGAPVDKTFRLADAEPLKEALRKAKKAAMVLIVSDEVYDSVVRHGPRTIDPAAFGKVFVDAKELRHEPAWIQVPRYSYPPDLPPVPAETEAEAEVAPPAAKAAAGTSSGQSGGISFINSDVKTGDIITTDKYVRKGRR